MPCDHKIAVGTVTEAEGGHDIEDGSTIVDATCAKCGTSGSVRILPGEMSWEYESEPEGAP